LKKVFLFIGLFILAFLSKAYYDTQTIEVRHYRIKDSPLAEALQGLKVAQLSDLHIKNIGKREEQVRGILEKEKPDLIFFTGDLIEFDGPYEPGFGFLRNLEAPLGNFAILGNTEYYNENGSCVLCHESGSRSLRRGGRPTYLRNTSTVKTIAGKEVAFLGLDNPLGKKADLRAALSGVPAGIPKVLLAHSPEVFQEAADNGLDLVLSGHTHGGQLWGLKGLKRFLPLEPALDHMEGFFQKGRTLMYVSKGVGTSFLPFRFGVRPEVTFFQFYGEDKGEAEDIAISNAPPETIFSGFSFSDFLDTFNVFPLILHKVFQIDSNGQTNRAARTDRLNQNGKLFDFESQEELETLNWECRKWFEISQEYKSSGKSSLKATLPPGQYPGISFRGVPADWSQGKALKMEVFNPSSNKIPFHIRIDDHKSGWEYATRYDKTFPLHPGENRLEIPLNTIKTNLHQKPMNLKKIDRFMVFVPDNKAKIELYLDNIRLE
jgi:hypothetical protein